MVVVIPPVMKQARALVDAWVIAVEAVANGKPVYVLDQTTENLLEHTVDWVLVAVLDE